MSLSRIIQDVATTVREAIPTAAKAGAAAGGVGFLGPLVHSPEVLTFVAQAVIVGLTVSGRFGLLRREVQAQSDKVASLEAKIIKLSCVTGKPCPTPPPKA